MTEKLEQTGWISEADAAEKLGLARDVMREFREGLAEGTDWRKNGRQIDLSHEAFLAIKKKMGGAEAEDGSDEALGASSAPDEAVELIVHHVPKLNVHLLVAKKEGAETLVRVKVRCNVNFLPGMKLKARPEGIYDDVFVMEGRCPRYRGRF